jgi:hypothetical protein
LTIDISYINNITVKNIDFADPATDKRLCRVPADTTQTENRHAAVF